jgi:hypothetical protein
MNSGVLWLVNMNRLVNQIEKGKKLSIFGYKDLKFEPK